MRSATLERTSSILAVLAATLPSTAWACPTCYSSVGEKVLSSYILSAAFMTLLPFSIIGIGAAIAFYLHRHADAADDEAAEVTSPS